jgi:CheY-like chemotaxis protein
LATSSTRVLVVDDFEPFRRLLCSTLQSKLDFETIVEASDGLEAVELAQILHPDLILLDIGLPKLDGIEAARRIHELSPRSRILFVSQESSVDALHAAFNAGASGYVVKVDVGTELQTAVKAVLRGERFVGSRFAGYGFTAASGARMPGSVLPRLQASSLNIGGAIEQGRYIPLDAAETISTFVVNSMLDPDRFLKVTGDLILNAAKVAKGERPRVAACGECAPLLWAQGNAEAAIRLELLWNEIAKSYDVDVLCGYPLGSFQAGMGSYIFDKLCAAHSAVHSR